MRTYQVFWTCDRCRIAKVSAAEQHTSREARRRTSETALALGWTAKPGHRNRWTHRCAVCNAALDDELAELGAIRAEEGKT